jgi:hypothetical protein
MRIPLDNWLLRRRIRSVSGLVAHEWRDRKNADKTGEAYLTHPFLRKRRTNATS